ncbi:pectinesterase family protein [Microbacterium jejuense]|uniref:pectinesterase family protein n=1 Tax=Microbacterium jejuense TaxID=1263637 RepID=UPI0031EC4C37
MTSGILALPALGIASAAVLASLAPAAHAAPATPPQTLYVAQDGSAAYRTVQAAVDAVPRGNTGAVTIVIAAGTYVGTVVIPADKPRISLIGATGDPTDVVITENHYAGMLDPSGKGFGTEGSATMTIAADDTTLNNLSVVNGYDPVLHRDDPGGQAVAMRTTGDRIALYNDRLIGRQDTLYVDTPTPTDVSRVYVRDSYIAGTVDFIFGRATAVFDHDTIDSVAGGYVTAANTDLGNPHGFLFTGSTFTGETDAGAVALGRPWHHTGDPAPFAAVVVRDSTLGAHISDRPWVDMSGWSWVSARYFEYRNTGDGATSGPDNLYRPQLTDQQAKQHTPQKYLAGDDHWAPWGYTVPAVSTAQQVCVPEQFGAVADGTTDVTASIQQALDACAGGGRVSLAGGRYVSGPVRVADHETVEVVRGSTWLATTDVGAYPASGSHLTSLIDVDGVSGVTLTGGGTIDGQGAPWWATITAQKAAGQPLSPRPGLLSISDADGITLDTLTLKDAPNSHVSLHGVLDSQVTGVTISAPADSPNTDGIDIWSSSGITVSRSSISDGDDNIALDSAPGEPTTGITVVDNRIGAGHGLSIGSYTGGGISDVRFGNNSLIGTTTGVRIKTARDRGGEITGITYDHLAMTDVDTAIGITSYYPKVPADGDPAQPVTATTPNIHDVIISAVSAIGSDAAGQIVGLPEQPLSAISLQSVVIAAKTGLSLRNAAVAGDAATAITVTSGQPFVFESNATYNGEGAPAPTGLAALSEAFDNVGTGTTAAPGDLDGGGRYVTRESAAAAGLAPDATVTQGAYTFTWPAAEAGRPDNATAGGETILLPGSGSTIGFLGLATSGNQTGAVTVRYTDGTTSSATLSFSDWWRPAPAAGDTAVATVVSNEGRKVGVFCATVPVDAGRTVAAVTLPDNAKIHIFDLALGD